MTRCVIIGGAEIADYGRARGMLRGDDFFICCDNIKHIGKISRIPHELQYAIQFFIIKSIHIIDKYNNRFF